MEGANTNLNGQYDYKASSAGRFRTVGLRVIRQGKGVTCSPQWLPVLLATAPSSPPLEIVGGHASTTCAPASYCNRENTPSSTWSTLLYSTAPSGNGSLLNLMQPVDDNVCGAIVRLSAVACVARNYMAGSVEIDLGEYCTLAVGNGFGCGAGGCYRASSSVTCWGGHLAGTRGYPTDNSDGYPGESVAYPDYRGLDMCEGARYVRLRGSGYCGSVKFLDDADTVSADLRISCIPPSPTSTPSPPPPPSPSLPLPSPLPPPYAFTSTASLKTAVQAYDANPTVAIETYGPIADWDVSAVTDMSFLFQGLQNFDADISSWDTSSVTTMRSMFSVRSSPCPAPDLQSGPLLHAACAAVVHCPLIRSTSPPMPFFSTLGRTRRRSISR